MPARLPGLDEPPPGLDALRGAGPEVENLADLITTLLHEVPAIRAHAHEPRHCGPIAFALAVYLRANSAPSGLMHLEGNTPSSPHPVGHYVATSDPDRDGGWVIDLAYRQFATEAPLPLVYRRQRLTSALASASQRTWWCPWQSISGELEDDDPLYPDFVDYPHTPSPLTYLAPGTDDPEWTTPIDLR